MASADPLDADPDDPTTFPRLAEQLLLTQALRVGDQVHRIVEVEVYAHAPRHPDPFAHQHPGQLTTGRWYFHQAGRSYRGGTFKGLDLTFGPPGVATGVLLRSLRTPEGQLVNGSSNCVEHLLRTTGVPTVAALDEALGGRRVDAPGGPLQLVGTSTRGVESVLATARVGLTLARAADHPQMTAYLGRPYRYLTDPTVPKGRVQTVLALHRQGVEPADIVRIASSTRAAVGRAVEAFERGRAAGSLDPWIGTKLSTTSWPEAYGAWVATEAP